MVRSDRIKHRDTLGCASSEEQYTTSDVTSLTRYDHFDYPRMRQMRLHRERWTRETWACPDLPDVEGPRPV